MYAVRGQIISTQVRLMTALQNAQRKTTAAHADPATPSAALANQDAAREHLVECNGATARLDQTVF
jgi:hypothetical protein